MISVSWAMMAHPKRSTQVRDILRALGEKIPVVWDAHNDRWNTGRTAMLAFDSGCTHHAVIQDDAVVPRDLVEGLPLILSKIPPDVPLCGYVGKVRPRRHIVSRLVQEADRRGASFITMHTLNWGVLIVVPTVAIPEMIAYSDKLTHIDNYDRRLSRFWEYSAQKEVWYTWPSIVDHMDGESLVPGRQGADGKIRRRVAHRFLGQDKSVLDLNWDGTVVREKELEPLKQYIWRKPDDQLLIAHNEATGEMRYIRPQERWKITVYSKRGWKILEPGG